MAFARPAEDGRPLSELNTTPLIDVLLVLLVMFILTIPMQTHKVGLDLPGPAPQPTLLRPEAVRNSITIDAGGTIRWNGTAVDRQTLRVLLARSMQLIVEPALDLRPAAETRYELVDAVVADIKRAGVTRLALPGNRDYQSF